MSALPRVLIVDDSRIVRISLAKQLQGHYEIREEADGEAAWQALVLDQDLKAVISDLQMPKLDGFALLERVRSSKLRRLQQLPFILVSGEETEADRGRAKSLGVSDFIVKGVGSAELLTRLGHLLALSRAHEDLAAGQALAVQNPHTGLYTRKYLELQAAQALSHAARNGGEVSVMVLGLDRYAGLCERLGTEVAEQVGSRLAKMILAKIRREDSLGHIEPGQYAIVSPGTSLSACHVFAERVRQAVAAANVVVHGQRLELTLSLGLAAVSEARVASAGALLELAGGRMREGMQAGGNRIVMGGKGVQLARSITLSQALEMVQAGQAEAVLPHLATLGRQLLPLLQLLDEELKLDLPLTEIDRRLSERARQKSADI